MQVKTGKSFFYITCFLWISRIIQPSLFMFFASFISGTYVDTKIIIFFDLPKFLAIFVFCKWLFYASIYKPKQYVFKWIYGITDLHDSYTSWYYTMLFFFYKSNAGF
jgi:hypothetical protein